MWVHQALFQRILDDNDAQNIQIGLSQRRCTELETRCTGLREQKTKDDITIDWMRHRVNALEKQNAILMGKATGLAFSVPEIVPTRPGTLSMPSFDTLPDFEDVGDDKAKELGLLHDAQGQVYDREGNLLSK